MNMSDDHNEMETEAARTAHKQGKPTSMTQTNDLPDGTRIITTKSRKGLVDGSLMTKTRTETFAAPGVLRGATTHVIKTRTKRINSGDGISYTTTTKKEMEDNPPITSTRVLPDGSRVIKTKTVTSGPVTTTTTVHLKNTPVTQQSAAVLDKSRNVTEQSKRFAMIPEIDFEDNEPMPLQYIGALHENDDEEAQGKLQMQETPLTQQSSAVLDESRTATEQSKRFNMIPEVAFSEDDELMPPQYWCPVRK